MMRSRLIVTPLTIQIAGGAAEALVLGRICFWFSAGKDGNCRAQIKRREKIWIAKSCDELAEEVGLSERQVRRAIDRLRKRGMIETFAGWFGGRKVLHLAPGYAAINDAQSVAVTRALLDAE
jgi:hypothetical protein